VLPHGLADQAPRLEIVDRLLKSWPTKPLWITAVRVGDGRLTWFGRGGFYSPTDADGLAGHDLDLFIVFSPMAHTWSGTSKSPQRRLARTVVGKARSGEVSEGDG